MLNEKTQQEMLTDNLSDNRSLEYYLLVGNLVLMAAPLSGTKQWLYLNESL